MEWNSSLYDNKHNFVAEYGKGLLEFVQKNKSQSILDLGCGTGTLTYQLAELCNKVVGVDSSENMINKAKIHYPNIDFMVCDALDLPFENEFDIVFSNAVFHWISDHNKLAENIYKVLKSNGLLVCEFGGSGNVATVEKSFQQASKEFNFQYKPKFNFPTVEEFGNVLSENGFVIDNIYDFDRPTVLKDKEQGLSNWMKQFYADELAEMPTEVQKKVLERTSSIAKEKLWNGKEWVADYRRLRVIAHKN